jgi:hypothetical protein
MNGKPIRVDGRVLALDIATRTGWATDGSLPGVPVTGVFQAPKAKGSRSEGREFGVSFAAYRAWLVEMIGNIEPEIVGFEAPLNVVAKSHGGGLRTTSQETVRLLFGLAAITEEVAQTLGVGCVEQNIGTIKRHFSGTGSADKEAMLAMCKRLNWEVGGDHNRADAAALWSLVKSLKDPKWAPFATPLFKQAAR